MDILTDNEIITHSDLFKRTRNWQNLQLATFVDTFGLYEMPQMEPVYQVPDLNWIGFNYARSVDKEDRKNHGLHMFLDDYQFQRLWADPDRYIPMLQEFGAVMSPDFSVYSDFPKAVQIWNVYRNMWLACYWQMNGITVIPTIMWGKPDTFQFCFDGYPMGGIVAVSTEGAFMSKDRMSAFMEGYNTMVDRLGPSGIILHGREIENLHGNIVGRIETFTQQIKAREKKAKTGGQTDGIT